jgi:hypothetical protein
MQESAEKRSPIGDRRHNLYRQREFRSNLCASISARFSTRAEIIDGVMVLLNCISAQ